MADEQIQHAKENMEKAIQTVHKELIHIRTGKATTALLDNVKVACYGQMMPLNQVASVNTPEVRLLTVQPWDKGLMREIEKAIMKSNFGLNPTNDGHLIRIAIPQLTEERRKELVKLVKKFGEDGKISVRNIRRDVNDKLKKMLKNKEIPEDELYRTQEESQKATDNAIKKIDEIVDKKEAEVMQV